MEPEDAWFLELSHSIDTCPSVTNVCPVVTPGARFLVVKRDQARLLHPSEALRFQGLSFKMLSNTGAEATANFTGKELQNLAGNSFASNHVCVATLVSLMVFGFPETITDLEALRVKASLELLRVLS